MLGCLRSLLGLRQRFQKDAGNRQSRFSSEGSRGGSISLEYGRYVAFALGGVRTCIAYLRLTE